MHCSALSAQTAWPHPVAHRSPDHRRMADLATPRPILGYDPSLSIIVKGVKKKIWVLFIENAFGIDTMIADFKFV